MAKAMLTTRFTMPLVTLPITFTALPITVDIWLPRKPMESFNIFVHSRLSRSATSMIHAFMSGLSSISCTSFADVCSMNVGIRSVRAATVT